MQYITIQSRPSRKGGCLATSLFLLLATCAIALTNLCTIPKLTLTAHNRTRIRHVEDFHEITYSPTRFHQKVFSATGTVAWSGYFYFGGFYQFIDTAGSSIYIFTKRIPDPKGTVIEKQILYLKVVGVLDTRHLYIIQEVNVTTIPSKPEPAETFTMQ